MTRKERATIEMMKGIKTNKLIELWKEADKHEITEEVARVRGWIMEALESKNKEAFNNWMEAGDEPEAHFA